MTPIIAIVGRPNVGKSTLFNWLTRTRNALVADMPGVTRDRIYGSGEVESKKFIVIDTGGIVGDNDMSAIAGLTEKQSYLAIQEADVVLFLVDAREGLQPHDYEIADKLRTAGKKVFVVANKVDGLNEDVVTGDFYSLGLGPVYSISAAHGRGVLSLIQEILEPFSEEDITDDKNVGIRVAIVGRPNAGKSTLINRLLGEERVIAHDMPGTTRDSIFIPFEREGQQYTLVDTAGVRRRAKIFQKIEQFSVIKSFQAISVSPVVVLVIDARENISDQDLKILGFVLKEGRALIVVVNKWDNISDDQKRQVKEELDRRLDFVAFAKIHFISALHGTGVGNLFGLIQECYRSASIDIKTNQATKLLEQAVEDHQPPLVGGRRIKLRYAHAGGSCPPTIIIHGNQVNKLPNSYKRYLENFYREKLNLVGTPIRIELKANDNPFAEKVKLIRSKVKADKNKSHH
jgi:GTP-binding protein